VNQSTRFTRRVLRESTTTLICNHFRSGRQEKLTANGPSSPSKVHQERDRCTATSSKRLQSNLFIPLETNCLAVRFTSLTPPLLRRILRPWAQSSSLFTNPGNKMHSCEQSRVSLNRRIQKYRRYAVKTRRTSSHLFQHYSPSAPTRIFSATA
jgi:hypothetical protein